MTEPGTQRLKVLRAEQLGAKLWYDIEPFPIALQYQQPGSKRVSITLYRDFVWNRGMDEVIMMATPDSYAFTGELLWLEECSGIPFVARSCRMSALSPDDAFSLGASPRQTRDIYYKWFNVDAIEYESRTLPRLFRKYPEMQRRWEALRSVLPPERKYL